MSNAIDLIRRFEDLRARRASWEGHWQELAEHVLPRRADVSGPRTPGEKRTLRLFDGTAIEANELLAAGLHGMLTSPATQWFELALKDQALADDQAVHAWLDETARRMHAALNASNFQTEAHELYLDLGCFGTAAMFIEEDRAGGVRFSTRPLSEIFIAQDAEGRIDTVFRRFTFTARQAVQRWGEAAVGPRIAKLHRDGASTEVALVHAVFPRAETAPGRVDALNLPLASVYVDPDGEHVLSEGGFQELPYVVPRWSKAAGEIFGRSPAMKALADIRMLNEMCRTTIKAAQKVVDPPLLVADDGVMLPVHTTPGAVNYARFLADGGLPVRPLDSGAQVGLGLQMEESRRKAIRSAFFVDQLQIVGSPQMTATEVLQRAEEKLRVLGPMLGRLQSEFLGPLIGRVYGILARAGQLPPPPVGLDGAALDLVYVSPIARAQRAVEAQGILRLIEIAGPLSQVQPDLVDNIDGDATLRHLWSLFAAPQALLRDTRQVAALRVGRSEQAAVSVLGDVAEGLATLAGAVPVEGGTDGA